MLPRHILAVAALSSLSMTALADETTSAFKGEANATYMKSSGSGNKETVKGRIETQYKSGKWTYDFKTEGLNEVDNDTQVRSSERYLAVEKTSWSFTERDYIFVKPQWEKDLQSGYEYQAFIAAGYGRNFIKTDTMSLSMDFGAGTRHTKEDTGLGGKTDAETMSNVALKYEWKILPNLRFNEDASAENAKDSSVYRTRSALTASITDVLGVSLVYETKRDTGPANIEDTLTTFGLNYRM